MFIGDWIQRFPINTKGRDLAIGDIHGHFSLVEKELKRIKFNPQVDRLFGVGDLVDRGPENKEAYKFLSNPWFHTVRGNHDDYVARYLESTNWLGKVGKWFNKFTDLEKVAFADPFQRLPLIIEVETKYGKVGLLHAECPFDDWDKLIDRLSNPLSNRDFKPVANTCMFSRSKFEHNDKTRIDNIRAVIVGHQPVENVLKLGNTYYIDTEGWAPKKGKFTLFNLNGLQSM